MKTKNCRGLYRRAFSKASGAFKKLTGKSGGERRAGPASGSGLYPSAALAIYRVVSMQKIKACIALEKRSK